MKELMTHGVSERRGCALAGIRRSSYRYQAKADRDEELLKRIRALASKYPRFGYRRIWVMLTRAGEHVNRKRVWRLWKTAGLGLKRRLSRRRRSPSKVPGPLRAAYPRQVVTYDFMFDRTVGGRSLKILTVVDEYTREALAIVVGHRITAVDVIFSLMKAFDEQGWPEYIRSDNGPEFIAEVLQRWLAKRGVKTHHIDPASPWQNAYGESFNEKLRTECLNIEAFIAVEDAQEAVDQWRTHYNEDRPHSSLKYQTPAEVNRSWERTRKELSFSPAPGALRASRGEGGQEGKTIGGSGSVDLTG